MRPITTPVKTGLSFERRWLREAGLAMATFSPGRTRRASQPVDDRIRVASASASRASLVAASSTRNFSALYRRGNRPPASAGNAPAGGARGRARRRRRLPGIRPGAAFRASSCGAVSGARSAVSSASDVPPHSSNTRQMRRVGVLHVIHRIVGVLGDRQVDVEDVFGVGLAGEQEEAHRVLAGPLDEGRAV